MRNNPLRRVRKVEDKQLHDAGSMAGALGTRSVEDGGADGVTFIDQAWVADGVRALRDRSTVSELGRRSTPSHRGSGVGPRP
ncbi:hypothetical protein JCM18918_13 [Cutibacterium acnes JCM 18918]|nr:hypothetical protein JCM18918_13 [Cutibacterium acnes JCM 18918]